MKNVTKALSSVTLGLMMAGIAHADTFHATATVSSAISLVETTALDLGTLSLPTTPLVSCVYANDSTFEVKTDGSAAIIVPGSGNCAGADIVSLSPETPGRITVTGALPFGFVTVDSNAIPTALIHSSGGPSSPTIIFATLKTLPADGNVVMLDADGSGDIVVGGVFRLEDGSVLENNYLNPYQDGVYMGTYDITVSY